MRASCGVRASFGIYAALLLLSSRQARADANDVRWKTVRQSEIALALVPHHQTRVAMAKERVVLIPFYSLRHKRALMLVNVYYDFANSGKTQSLTMGFPELYGKKRQSTSVEYKGDYKYMEFAVHRRPSILSFAARVAGKQQHVLSHPGVGKYRLWHVFSATLPTGRTRVHNVYEAEIGSYQETSAGGVGGPGIFNPAWDAENGERRFWFEYILHTGRRWKGPIGKGEIVLFFDGRHRLVRRFAQLEPTPADDVTFQLPMYKKRFIVIDGGANYEPDGQKLDKSKLVRASSWSHADSVNTNPALAFDRDPRTAWVAENRDKTPWIQFPADRKAKLRQLRISARAQTTGQSRPERVVVECRKKGGVKKAAAADLADDNTVQTINLTSPLKCKTVRLKVVSTHGGRNTSVAITALTPVYTGDDARKEMPAFKSPPLPAFVKVNKKAKMKDHFNEPVGAGSTIAALSRAGGKEAYESVKIVNVSWSADGSMVHYQCIRQNLKFHKKGLAMGYFVDVATGKIKGCYRMQRIGALSSKEQALWNRAAHFVDAQRFLQKHGFEKTEARALPPADLTRALPPHTVETGLDSASKNAGKLSIAQSRYGWRWRFHPTRKSASRKGSAKEKGAPLLKASVTFLAKSDKSDKGDKGDKDKKEKVIYIHKPHIDLAYARKHARYRQVILKNYREAVRNVADDYNITGSVSDFNRAVFPDRTAFTGAVYPYWSPQGDAVLVMWDDYQSMSALYKNKKIPYGGPTARKWQYGRFRTQVTVHTLASRKPSALEPPQGRRRSSTSATDPTADSKAKDSAAARAQKSANRSSTSSRRSTSKSSKSAGCGCRTVYRSCLLPATHPSHFLANTLMIFLCLFLLVSLKSVVGKE